MQGNNDGANQPTERRSAARSGDFSVDQRFDPEALFEVVADADNAQQAAEAMRTFIARGDSDALAKAIAIYTRAARARGKSMENVLAELNMLSALQQERYNHQGKLLEPSELKKLVLRTVFDSFGES